MREHTWSRREILGAGAGLAAGAALGGLALPRRAGAAALAQPGCADALFVPSYADGRPAATLRMDAVDHGPVLRHGDGPDQCDVYGARDIWVFEADGTYYMHYDAAGAPGWLCALATSADGLTWSKRGTVLELGAPGADDSGTASYGVTYRDGDDWHMFYVGSPNTTPPPDRIPAFPYYTMKATGPSPAGPWTKRYDVTPLRPTPGTYYSATASPGQVIRRGDEYLQFISVSTNGSDGTKRSIGIARTRDLGGTWTLDPEPIVPLEEQIENTSLYYEPSCATWFMFTNHVGDLEFEYTDAIWVYWTKDLDRWDPDAKAVVLDRNNCAWSERVIGLPSVLPMGDRLAVYYDGAPGASTSHMGRDVGLAWLDLPLRVPRLRRPVNLARHAQASASSTYPGYAAEHVNDGSRSTGVADVHGWANAFEAADPHWLQLDFGRPRRFARVDLYTTCGYELRDYRIQIWTGTSWEDVIEPVTGNGTVYRSHGFRPVRASKLRVLCAYGSNRQPGFVRLNEIEVYPSAHPGADC